MVSVVVTPGPVAPAGPAAPVPGVPAAGRPVLDARTRRASVRWVGSLFAVLVVTQRFAAPGFPEVPVLLLLVAVWVGAGLLRGVLEVERRRAVLWLLAAGTTGLAVVAQPALVPSPVVSPTSWALFLCTWAPFVVVLRDRRRGTFLAALRPVVTVGTWLAAGCVVMMATQLAGLPYRDLLADVVPRAFLLQDFIITYPVFYGSPLYRANAWIGLEPSMVSAQLGLCVVAALLTRRRAGVVALLVCGLVAASAGSGLALVGVAVVVLAWHPARRLLARYLPVAVGAALLVLVAPWGASILSRFTEASTERSSTSLRATLPYEYLWPQWVGDPAWVLLGRGPGSSQRFVADSGILGLLVPTPVKIFFDYGLVAGLVLAVFMAYCYVEGPSRAFAGSLAVSMWAIQPGATTTVLVLPVLLLVTVWAPRHGPVVEADPNPPNSPIRATST